MSDAPRGDDLGMGRELDRRRLFLAGAGRSGVGRREYLPNPEAGADSPYGTGRLEMSDSLDLVGSHAVSPLAIGIPADRPDIDSSVWPDRRKVIRCGSPGFCRSVDDPGPWLHQLLERASGFG